MRPEDLAYVPPVEHKRKKIIFLTFAVLFVCGVAVGSYFFLHKPAPKVTQEDATQKEFEGAQKKTQEVLGTVAKQVKLPVNEEPIFATVSDREKLQGQDFFKEAQNGDKILIYKKNKKAYLYRPSTKQVLATAPLDYQETPNTASVAAEATQSLQTSEPSSTIQPHGKVLINQQ